MKIKRFTTLLLALMLLCSLGLGLAQAEEEIRTFKLVTVDWGTSSIDHQLIVDEINRKLLEDGEKFQLETIGIPFDTWEQKTSMMLNTGEPFDALVVMGDVIPVSSYYNRGYTYPLTDIIEQYGQNLKKMIPEGHWQSATINGEIQCIPNYGTQAAGVWQDMMFYKHVYDKYGVELPTTVEEMIAGAEYLKQQEPEKIVVTKANIFNDGNCFLHRDYDSWPFAVYNETFYVDQQGNVKAWIDTEEFKQDAKTFETMINKGLIPRDILTRPNSDYDEFINNDLIFFDTDPTLSKFEYLVQVNPDAEITNLWLRPEKTALECYGMSHAWIVPITSENPDLAVRFFNWLYSEEENHDLMIYGIENVHWRKSDKVITAEGIDKVGTVIEKIYDEIDGVKTVRYRNDMWMWGNMNYAKYYDWESPAQLVHNNPPMEIETGIAVGFTFDPTPVQTEYANVMAEIPASCWPIKYGIVSYEEGYQAMRDKMTAAGVDVVVAEYERQFKAWLETK